MVGPNTGGHRQWAGQGIQREGHWGGEWSVLWKLEESVVWGGCPCPGMSPL
jgi:hypothetical protein